MNQNTALAQTAISNPNSVIANPAPNQPLSTQWQQDQPNEMNVFQPAGQPEERLPRIFRYGPLQLHPHADYSLMYGNGIQSAPGAQQDSIIQSFAPGIRMDVGQHWTLDYTPSFQFYSDAHFQDTVNHSVTLTGNVFYEDWVFGLVHGTQFSSSPTVGTGSQTEQWGHNTTFTGAHPLGAKTSVDLALNQNIALVKGFEDSYDWNTLDWVNYQFWPRLTAGIGVGGGYVKVHDNSGTTGNENLDQTYEQAQVRINWRATDKVSFQLSGGFEDRQFMSPGIGNSLAPIFGATIEYLPFKDTQISLNASRTISSSDYYIVAQEAETTEVGISVNQQLFKKFSLGLGLAYSQMDYNTALNLGPFSANANRTDDEVAFTARLSHPFFKRGTWSIFYSYSDNRSSQPGFSFISNQSGFEVGYSF